MLKKLVSKSMFNLTDLKFNNIQVFHKNIQMFVYRCNIIMPMYLLCRDYRKMCTIPIKYFTAKILREKMKKKS